MVAVRLERLTDERLRATLDQLAKLRIAVFRDWPYLYAGDPDYEARYLRRYAEARDSVVVGAFDRDRLVGAATALPLRHEPDSLKGDFAARGYLEASVFYFGESVLLREYRGTGVGVRFFEEREAAALEHPEVRYAAFCGVVRPDDHLKRPDGYVPLDRFWSRRGYERIEGLTGSLSWRDLDEREETAKPMQFWIKRLR